jgi:hypothetical protein
LVVVMHAARSLELLQRVAGARVNEHEEAAPMNVPMRIEEIGECAGINAAALIMKRECGVAWINPTVAVFSSTLSYQGRSGYVYGAYVDRARR